MRNPRQSEIVSNAMRRDKFEKVKKYFHLVDNDQIENNKFDRLYKIRPLCDILPKAWQKFGVFRKTICVDEQMVPYYGHHLAKQYMKGKPVRYGYKIFMLCSSDGFCYNFIVYCGKNNEMIPPQFKDMTHGSRIVLQLIQCIPDPAEHILFFDNYFTSYDLLLQLRNLGIRATGTVRENRLKLAKDSLKDISKQERGEFDYVSDENVVACRWLNCKVVCLSSNFESVQPVHYCMRRVCGSKNKVQVKQPNFVAKYNSNMGGVDLFGPTNFALQNKNLL